MNVAVKLMGADIDDVGSTNEDTTSATEEEVEFTAETDDASTELTTAVWEGRLMDEEMEFAGKLSALMMSAAYREVSLGSSRSQQKSHLLCNAIYDCLQVSCGYHWEDAGIHDS